MQAREGDDFSAFAGSEHMFFHLSEPYKLIREELEQGLRRQVPDTVVKSIQTFGQPKFLTSGRKADDGTLIVTAFGFSVLALILVSSAAEPISISTGMPTGTSTTKCSSSASWPTVKN